jgi:predicted transcriptional regulator
LFSNHAVTATKTINHMRGSMKPDWTREVIERYGHLPIWTALWCVHYVQHQRIAQTYAEAERLAREQDGQVILPVRVQEKPRMNTN